MIRLAAHAMGTRFELVLPGEHRGAAGTRLRAAGEEALAEVEEAERRLSLFRRDSLLAHLNRCAGTGPVRVDVDTFELLALCDNLVRASDGAFDPTVAPLMRAHGLHGDGVQTPACDSLAGARARVGWDGVVLDRERRTVRFERPGVSLDLGGVGKGHGLDLAARALREAGVERALLHGGTSSVVAIGAPTCSTDSTGSTGSPGWRVALGPGPEAPVAVLRDGALSVSAPEGRVAPGPHGLVTHVLDPRTGAPAAHVAIAAAVADSAALADAWSTALLVAGDALAPHPDVETLYAVGAVQNRAWRHRSRGPHPPRFTRIPPVPLSA